MSMVQVHIQAEGKPIIVIYLPTHPTTMTVGQLKDKVANVMQQKYHRDKQQLVFQGTLLEDETKTLSSYNIIDKTVIHVFHDGLHNIQQLHMFQGRPIPPSLLPPWGPGPTTCTWCFATAKMTYLVPTTQEQIHLCLACADQWKRNATFLPTSFRPKDPDASKKTVQLGRFHQFPGGMLGSWGIDYLRDRLQLDKRLDDSLQAGNLKKPQVLTLGAQILDCLPPPSLLEKMKWTLAVNQVRLPVCINTPPCLTTHNFAHCGPSKHVARLCNEMTSDSSDKTTIYPVVGGPGQGKSHFGDELAAIFIQTSDAAAPPPQPSAGAQPPAPPLVAGGNLSQPPTVPAADHFVIVMPFLSNDIMSIAKGAWKRDIAQTFFAFALFNATLRQLTEVAKEEAKYSFREFLSYWCPDKDDATTKFTGDWLRAQVALVWATAPGFRLVLIVDDFETWGDDPIDLLKELKKMKKTSAVLAGFPQEPHKSAMPVRLEPAVKLQLIDHTSRQDYEPFLKTLQQDMHIHQAQLFPFDVYEVLKPSVGLLGHWVNQRIKQRASNVLPTVNSLADLVSLDLKWSNKLLSAQETAASAANTTRQLLGEVDNVFRLWVTQEKAQLQDDLERMVTGKVQLACWRAGRAPGVAPTPVLHPFVLAVLLKSNQNHPGFYWLRHATIFVDRLQTIPQNVRQSYLPGAKKFDVKVLSDFNEDALALSLGFIVQGEMKMYLNGATTTTRDFAQRWLQPSAPAATDPNVAHRVNTVTPGNIIKWPSTDCEFVQAHPTAGNVKSIELFPCLYSFTGGRDAITKVPNRTMAAEVQKVADVLAPTPDGNTRATTVLMVKQEGSMGSDIALILEHADGSAVDLVLFEVKSGGMKPETRDTQVRTSLQGIDDLRQLLDDHNFRNHKISHVIRGVTSKNPINQQFDWDAIHAKGHVATKNKSFTRANGCSATHWTGTECNNPDYTRTYGPHTYCMDCYLALTVKHDSLHDAALKLQSGYRNAQGVLVDDNEISVSFFMNSGQGLGGPAVQGLVMDPLDLMMPNQEYARGRHRSVPQYPTPRR